MPAILPEQSSAFLHCHPLTAAAAVHSVAAGAAWSAGGELLFRFEVRGDIARLRIPLPQRGGATDGLWQHTCFEAFVANRGDNAYREFNFSPSGQWASYAFSAWRERADARLPSAPRIEVEATAGRLVLTAIVEAVALSPIDCERRLDVGLSAVVESDLADGALSYWALAHAAGRPDFHRREGFTIDLPAFTDLSCNDDDDTRIRP